MTFKELRKQSGMTQQQFADYFGIPKRTIENWEAGVNKCPKYLLDLMKYKLEQKKRHGRWGMYEKAGVIHYKCPFCETIFAYIKEGHIAPNECKCCGAKMDE